MNSKKIITISVLVIVLVISSLGLLAYFEDRQDSSKTNQSTDTSESQPTENPPERIEGSIPEGQEPISLEESYEYTDEIISPNSIVNSPNDYVDMTLVTRGWIREVVPGEFILVSVNIDEPFGLQLAENSDIEFNSYVDPSGDPSRTATPVLLTGSLGISDETNNMVFVVTTIAN